MWARAVAGTRIPAAAPCVEPPVNGQLRRRRAPRSCLACQASGGLQVWKPRRRTTGALTAIGGGLGKRKRTSDLLPAPRYPERIVTLGRRSRAAAWSPPALAFRRRVVLCVEDGSMVFSNCPWTARRCSPARPAAESGVSGPGRHCQRTGQRRGTGGTTPGCAYPPS